MSEMAKKFIGYFAQEASNRAQAGGGTGLFWPASDGISNADAITYLDIYHDLVKNKGYALPTDAEKSRLLTNAIRAKLGIKKGTKKFLGPTLTIMKINEVGSNVNPELYNWLFPNRITKEPEKPWYDPLIPGDQSGDGKGSITESLDSIKWIAFAGLATLVILQTGVLKKISGNA